MAPLADGAIAPLQQLGQTLAKSRIKFRPLFFEMIEGVAKGDGTRMSRNAMSQLTTMATSQVAQHVSNAMNYARKDTPDQPTFFNSQRYYIKTGVSTGDFW